MRIMIKIKNSLQKRKVKIFLIFLFFSSMSWFINKLADDYTGRAAFDVVYTNVPDSLLFVGASKDHIEVKLKASGFTFLGFGFKNKTVTIDVSKAEKKDDVYRIPRSVYQLQIEKQLPQSMEFLGVDEGDAIVLEIYTLKTKKVPVIERLKINFSQNFMLDGAVLLSPDSILVKGPEKVLNEIESIQTEVKTISNVTEDFSEELLLQTPENTDNITYLTTKVFVKGKVVRFSEKIIEVPIKVLNLPEDFEIKLFPDTVKIVCMAKIDDLKELQVSDFNVVADYNAIQDESQHTILLKLELAPDFLSNIRLMSNEVRYILKRK
ncbi:YbbR family protein [Cellulophaga algicola DSM 14237]|uniref:YbbR family protein n=3 Tax=Cellulophaga TaxID=104264 RepID=E6X4B7_CELAD|nr:YbbR family protein [Cellulophaga algicola DSM 14237]